MFVYNNHKNLKVYGKCITDIKISTASKITSRDGRKSGFFYALCKSLMYLEV